MGHIEDIVVNKDQQGKKLGLRIIEALDYIAEKVGCYKVSPPALRVTSRPIPSPLSQPPSLLYAPIKNSTPHPSPHPQILYSHHPTRPSNRQANTRLPDNPRLLRNERRLLRQMRLQASRIGNGALLRQMTQGSQLTKREAVNERHEKVRRCGSGQVKPQ